MPTRTINNVVYLRQKVALSKKEAENDKVKYKKQGLKVRVLPMSESALRRMGRKKAYEIYVEAKHLKPQKRKKKEPFGFGFFR